MQPNGTQGKKFIIKNKKEQLEESESLHVEP